MWHRTTPGLNGFTGAAPVPPRAVISSSSSRDRRGLTPAEIALLPVRHFVRPSVARSSTAGAVAGVTEKETCLLHGSGSGGGSRSGILEVELACRRQDGEARPPLPRMKRLRQGQRYVMVDCLRGVRCIEHKSCFSCLFGCL